MMLYFDGRPVEVKFFPNRELYVETLFLSKEDPAASHTIGLCFQGNDDIIALLLLKGQMDDMGFSRVILNLPFFPYSTMDHVDSPQTRPLSLRYIANLVNSMGFERVKVMEPHSTVLAPLVARLDVENMTLPLMEKAIVDLAPDMYPVICFPDMGAMKRYEPLVDGKYPILSFNKKRNFNDGVICGTRCIDEMPNLGENHVCIITDDLCRSGYTFTLCADLLKKAGAGYVILCVTHMEMGAFNGVLKDDSPVDFVYATNSCLPAEHPVAEKLRLIDVWKGV